MTRARGDTLATLGRVWRQREDRMRQAVLAAQGDVALLRGRMVRLQAALADNSAAVRAVLDSRQAAPDMAGYRRQAGEIRVELSSQRRRLAAGELVLASRRVELAAAIKQRRALERLANKRSAAGAAENQRRWQKELDDLHSARAAAGRAALAPNAAARPQMRQETV